tara:strand:- start:5968 stop:7284 length:1317 start_codon:yes stop_codon:yes gene_type:complete
MILGKKIGILGAAKSGVAAARLAVEMGYEVVLSDIDKNKKIDTSLKNFIKFELGCHSNLILDCDIIVVSPGIPPDQPIIINAVNKKIPIISEIEFASWFTKSKILTVTGSNGKSTTVSILSEIFSKSKYNGLLGGNIGTTFSENILLEKNTKKSDLIVHILELSSFQIERLDKFNSHLGCILNLSEDHLDRYEGMKDYANAKIKLAEHCGLLYYDSNSKELSSKLKNYTDTCPVILNKYFYIENNAIYKKKSKEILFHIDETRLIGQHNLKNAFYASVLAKSFGIDNESIIKGVVSFKPLPHRLEKVDCSSKVNFYNDSKSTNIKSTIKALNSFNEKVILILGGKDKGSDFSKLTSSLNCVKKVFCYGECGQDILKILKPSVDVQYVEKFKDCVNGAIENAKDGCNILLSPACSSYDQFDNYEQRGDEFKNIVGRVYE